MVKQNGADVHDKVAKLAAASGVDVVATNSGWVDDGINFGSNYVTPLKKPAIAMLWDSPTSSSSAGQARFVLERQYGYPVTVLRASSLMAADLNRFQVLIMPDAGGFGGGGYGQAIPAPAAERIRAWVRAGGVLIALGGGAVNYLASPAGGLLAVQQEGLARESAAGARGAGDAARPGGATGPAAAAPSGGAAPAARPPANSSPEQEDFDKAIQADAIA